ncbi:MAG: hypothetical protein NC084_12960 [Bacteroides sp.]|nr:hypothetical protein [Eubacterium sp.]MCM1419641.1 hypothetical protein [Roseburia sp.]MCM1463605.1 hypothetical protein [Bacteroides sp.]
MKSLVKKTTVALVGAAIVLETVSLAGAEEKPENAQEALPTEANETEKEEVGRKDLIQKEETVYIFADAKGETEKILASDHLKNPNGEKTLSDYSELRDIENAKGDESFTGSGELVWSADGNDIYYSGTTDKEPPVELRITYTLDGAEISPDALAGKSGAVTIRYDLTNRTAETVAIAGDEEEIPVPFAAISAVILDNDIFRNIELVNAKCMDDGDRTAVVGFTLPGLNRALGLSEDEFPEFFEIRADVKDFSLANTYTVVTSEVFREIGIGDPDLLSDTDGLSDSADQLTDAMEQLTDGSLRLMNGLGELSEKSEGLVDGVGALSEGSEQLKSGAKELADGAGTLSEGMETLSGGLRALDENSAVLNAAAEQVFALLLSAAQSQLVQAGIDVPALTAENYGTVLNGILESLSDESAEALARNKIETAVNEQRDMIEEKVTEAVREQVKAAVLSSLKMTAEEYEAGVRAGLIPDEQQKQIEAAIDEQMAADEQKAIVSAKTDEQIKSLVDEKLRSEEVQAQIADGKASVQAGREKITVLLSQLDAYREFYTGLAAYTDGVASAKGGAEQLQEGASSLKRGADTLAAGSVSLDEGIGSLNDGLPAMIDGIGQLYAGSGELYDGIVRLDEEGISKLTEVFGGDLVKLKDRLDALSDLAERYQGYGGGASETKFIYRTENIG